jgi:hypothetical protein
LAEKRIALVIGNNDYLEVPKLQKAVGDANAIAEKLTKLGFKVTLAVDLDRRKLNLALSKLYSDIEPGDTVAVHFSGHGVELQGQNYLLPIDAPAPENGGEDLLKSETLSLQQLVETLVDKKAGARILIIDACRDNPFAVPSSCIQQAMAKPLSIVWTRRILRLHQSTRVYCLSGSINLASLSETLRPPFAKMCSTWRKPWGMNNTLRTTTKCRQTSCYRLQVLLRKRPILSPPKSKNCQRLTHQNSHHPS